MARIQPSQRRPQRIINPIIRYLLFFVNVLIWLVGLAVLGTTAWVLQQKNKKVYDALDFFLDPACVLCLAGCIVAVVTFFGYMGPLRLNRVMLIVYYWSVSIFLLLEIGAAILLFVLYSVPDVSEKIFPEDSLSGAIVRYQSDEDLVDIIDSMQRELECCGLSNDDKGYTDWNMNMYFNCNDTNRSPLRCSVPPSCCVLKPEDPINLLCGKEALSQTSVTLAGKVNVNGCLKALGLLIEDNALVIGGCLVGILIPQIILLWMARGLCMDILDEQREADHRRVLEEARAAAATRQNLAEYQRY